MTQIQKINLVTLSYEMAVFSVGDEKMKKILLLATGWQTYYWESDKEAPYPGTKYTTIPEWDDLSRSCPLPGIGIYIKQKDKDLRKDPFVYLIITGMRYDPSTEKPYFTFKAITKSKKESQILSSELPPANKKLFSVIDSERLVGSLRNIGETPPKEWENLIEAEEEIISWKDYIGKYFLEIKGKILSNNEFEDRVAALLCALGFGVEQRGHMTLGEYPDGIASLDNDYTMVYDCKNTQSFAPSAEDERAIKKYAGDEKKIRGGQKIYSVFIAKSFRGKVGKDIFYFSIDSLLYLLYKNLILGSKFILSPLKKVIDNFTSLEEETIDKEWRC